MYAVCVWCYQLYFQERKRIKQSKANRKVCDTQSVENFWKIFKQHLSELQLKFNDNKCPKIVLLLFEFVTKKQKEEKRSILQAL